MFYLQSTSLTASDGHKWPNDSNGYPEMASQFSDTDNQRDYPSRSGDCGWLA